MVDIDRTKPLGDNGPQIPIHGLGTDFIGSTGESTAICIGKAVFDFSRDGALRSLEESLKRLKVDYVDIVHVHDPDDHFDQALDEAFPAILQLREQGVIQAIGSGMNQWQMLREFALNTEVNCFLLAGRYTLLEQTSLSFLKLCQEKGIGNILGGVNNFTSVNPRPER